nr:reverse transcriptase domain-containing protein [Tanacetum cinerariifolium]
MFKQLHINITLADALILIRKYHKLLKSLLFNKEKLLEMANTPLNENCSAVILKKLPEKLEDPGKFLILVTTSSSSPNHLLEEFANELALITFPPGNDDLPFDIESNLKEIEYFLNNDPIKEMDSILEDSIDEDTLADLNDNLANTMPEMFIDEHALDYSSPPLYDEYDNDLFEVESDTEYVYDDPFNSKGEKIKESKLLIDELDLPRSSDFLPSPKYDSFLFEDFSKVDALPSIDNEDKDFDPPLYELPFLKEVLGYETLLSFSFENDEKVFKPGILTSKGVHSSLLLEISHQDHKVSKIIKILESPMEIFPCFCRKNIRILDVPYLHFYPP